MSTQTKPVDLEEGFDRLAKTVLRCKAERDRLLVVAKMALEALTIAQPFIFMHGTPVEYELNGRQIAELEVTIRFAEEPYES